MRPIAQHVTVAALALVLVLTCACTSKSDETARVTCTTEEAGCGCTLGTSAGSPCGPAQVPAALCCASKDWPTAGTCTCQAVTCDEDARGAECACKRGLGGPLVSCSGALCCQRAAGDCYCRRSGGGQPPACEAGDTPSAFCGASAGTHCPSDTVEVVSCLS